MSGTDRYRRLSLVYDHVVDPMLSGVRRAALDVVRPEPGWEVLDVGCGTGTGLETYVAAGCRVSGVDVSPSMLAKARARLGNGADLRLIDGAAIPFADDRFDLVTTSMVLHEVPAAERPELLTEMARVVEPGGRVMVVDFRFGSRRGWRGPAFSALGSVVERFSGHYSGYRSFRASGGVPAVVGDVGLTIEREKIVAGGAMAIYVLRCSG